MTVPWNRQSVYIIAELGVNHDGSVEKALRLVDDAAEAGADAIKLQVFEAERLMSGAARLAAYQEQAGERDPVEMLRRLELSFEELAEVAARAHQRGLHAIATVFSVELVGPAQGIGWDAFKTASPDIVHRPLLEAIAETGKPIIVSTGASTIEEVERAVLWLAHAREQLALLHCVSAYPVPDAWAWLGGIPALREIFDGPVGYSDHTMRTDTGALAVSLGATILEKHLTHDRQAQGPDHAASLDANGLREYVRLARCADAQASSEDVPRDLFGERQKRVLDIERDVRAASRQSIVAARMIAEGARIERADLTFKRPGTGIETWRIDELVGRIAARTIQSDALIVEEDVR